MKTIERDKKAKRILYTLKSTPSAMLGFMKGMDFIGEMIMRQLFILLTSKEYYEKNEKLNDC